mmetsp:Transcript_64006/g.152629  ORF Transcript_64006/g.152629 Transcript_64006/m.152629 type:complete len:304 (-) Transcript_64006:71-982(-)|eukprot:CAMPEP_0178420272 /NCGR_PEP_ID=MMETSP0689_2-20121128/26043_1 /TAXON_ID=160604 /ORGANISM="Amphidinium massartii, Strain CS-259" /LENGTH=303 /DNA_ID=CAMNT_0020041741 /DNA_START=39 /DNA_END=950 /DNA_ORIENTATION=-
MAVAGINSRGSLEADAITGRAVRELVDASRVPRSSFADVSGDVLPARVRASRPLFSDASGDAVRPLRRDHSPISQELRQTGDDIHRVMDRRVAEESRALQEERYLLEQERRRLADEARLIEEDRRVLDDERRQLNKVSSDVNSDQWRLVDGLQRMAKADADIEVGRRRLSEERQGFLDDRAALELERRRLADERRDLSLEAHALATQRRQLSDYHSLLCEHHRALEAERLWIEDATRWYSASTPPLPSRLGGPTSQVLPSSPGRLSPPSARLDKLYEQAKRLDTMERNLLGGLWPASAYPSLA